MARVYIYTDFKTRKIIFETTQPNFVSPDDVDLMVKTQTGRDPRLEKSTIERDIRMVEDN